MTYRAELEQPLEQAWRAIAEARAWLGEQVSPAERARNDAEGTLEALDRTAGRVARARSAPRPAAVGETAGSDEIVSLRLRAARADLLAVQLARQRSMAPMLSAGVAALRNAPTLDDLVESIPVHTARLGYERVMFSWVDNERWVPRSMYTMSGPTEAAEILAAGSPPHVHVRDLLEVDVVRRRRTILVLDADSNPRVHPNITPVSQSRTYVAAPIVARNHVAAFVHLDRNVETGLNDEFDRHLLALFCESIGALVDRLLSVDNPVAAPLPMSPTLVEWTQALTSREHDVLRLVAQGLTNAEIGQRLFVSPETTKSHLKNLMRKLGARNRGEAAALFHSASLEAAGPHEPPESLAARPARPA